MKSERFLKAMLVVSCSFAFSPHDSSVPTTLDDSMLFGLHVAHALLRAVSRLVSTLFYQYGATRVGAQCHLVFDVTNNSKDFRSALAKRATDRRQEAHAG